MEKSVMTIREVSREFNFPEYGVRTLVKTGAFPVVKCGNRAYIVRSTFERYLESGGEVYNAKQR